VNDGRPDILHLTHRVPYPPDKGDRIRSFHTLRFLSRHARVHLASLADEPVAPGALSALERYCARVAVVPISRWLRNVRALVSLLRSRSATAGAFNVPRLHTLLDDWTRDTHFDVCLASASSMIPYLRTDALRRVPAVVDLVDVDSQKWLDFAAASRGPRAWFYRAEGRQLRRVEQELPAWVRGVVLSTPAEVAIYEQFVGAGTALAVPNGVDLEYFRPALLSAEPSCVFVGALDYRPNVDGIGWFCGEVWPRLRERRPDARLFIVGRHPVEAVRRLGGTNGVEVLGTVPDVRPWLARAAVAVAPLRIARGVQNKILEALALARAVVATPVCLQGLTTEPGRHLLSASTTDEWVTSLDRLLGDAGFREQLGASGRAFVEEHHCWDRCLEPLQGLLLGGAEGRLVLRPRLV
jgi:polysaccharide biosynthesis protein PslH